MSVRENVVQAKNLGKSYGAVTALDDISFVSIPGGASGPFPSLAVGLNVNGSIGLACRVRRWHVLRRMTAVVSKE